MLSRWVGAAEVASGVVDLRWGLEVADVAAIGDHEGRGVRNRLLEPVCDAERRPHVELAPDQEGGYGDVWQQVALVCVGHREQLRLEAVGQTVAALCSSSAAISIGGSPANIRVALNRPARWAL